MSERTEKCPKCKHIFIPSVMLKDGGSNICPKCTCVFHRCVNQYKIGSPGPSLCPQCRSQ